MHHSIIWKLLPAVFGIPDEEVQLSFCFQMVWNDKTAHRWTGKNLEHSRHKFINYFNILILK
jgi:hypothetical protein